MKAKTDEQVITCPNRNNNPSHSSTHGPYRRRAR